MSNIKYRYALNARREKVYSIDQAKREDGPFICLDCGRGMIPKKGDINAHHFSHEKKSDGTKVTSSECSGVSSQHEEAKHLVKDHLHKWVIVLKCSLCGTTRQSPRVTKTFTANYEARVEQGVGKYRVDVLVVGQNAPAAIFEVVWSHKLTVEKRTSLVQAVGENNVFEVQAQDILDAAERGGFKLHCRGDGFCDKCVLKRIKKCYDCGILYDILKVYGGGEIKTELRNGKEYRDNEVDVCETCVVKCDDCGKNKGRNKPCPKCEAASRLETLALENAKKALLKRAQKCAQEGRCVAYQEEKHRPQKNPRKRIFPHVEYAEREWQKKVHTDSSEDQQTEGLLSKEICENRTPGHLDV